MPSLKSVSPLKSVSHKPVAVMTSKGQLTVPIDIRRPLDLQSGDRLQFEIVSPDTVMLTVKRKRDALKMLDALPRLVPVPLDRVAVRSATDHAMQEKFGQTAKLGQTDADR